jgi:hypothetical protein
MSNGHTKYAEGQLLAVPALRKDGRQISIEFSIQLLDDADGRIAWVVAIVRDVTERYQRDKARRTEQRDVGQPSPSAATRASRASSS